MIAPPEHIMSEKYMKVSNRTHSFSNFNFKSQEFEEISYEKQPEVMNPFEIIDEDPSNARLIKAKRGSLSF